MSDFDEVFPEILSGAVRTALPKLCSIISSMRNIFEMLKSSTLMVSWRFELKDILVILRSVWVMPLLWQWLSRLRSCHMMEAADTSSK